MSERYAECADCDRQFRAGERGRLPSRCPDCYRSFRSRQQLALLERNPEYRQRQREISDEVRRRRLADPKTRLELLRLKRAYSCNHRGRKLAGESYVTTAGLLALLDAALNCPLCGVPLRDETHRADSKSIDHIKPLAVGGEHRISNLRVLCLACNAGRPNDGSDL